MPVEIRSPIQKSPNVATLEVIVKATHHQRGARSSTTPEIRSVSQLKLRRFRTSGARWICRSAFSIVSCGGAAPSMVKLPNSSFRYLLHQACDSDILRVRHL